MGIDFDAILKVLGGASFLGLFVAYINKVFISGDLKASNRRKADEDVRDVLQKLNADLIIENDEFQKSAKIDSEIRHWRVNQLNVLSWHFDEVRRKCKQVAACLRAKSDVPDNLISDLENVEESHTIMARVTLVDESKS